MESGTHFFISSMGKLWNSRKLCIAYVIWDAYEFGIFLLNYFLFIENQFNFCEIDRFSTDKIPSFWGEILSENLAPILWRIQMQIIFHNWDILFYQTTAFLIFICLHPLSQKPCIIQGVYHKQKRIW